MTSRRLRVLISAYACEPNKGSEPEVGWQWAMGMAQLHDVTVLTRSNNRPSIQAGLAQIAPGRTIPRFVFLDLSPAWLGVKKFFRATQLYYVAWQAAATRRIAQLTRETPFDVLHHVTFAAFRYPTAIWGHSVPSVWGPIGGVETVPSSLLPSAHLGSLVRETTRNLATGAAVSPLGRMRTRARKTTRIVSSTREMRDVFARHGFASTLMPAIGVEPTALPWGQPVPHSGPLRLLYVGNLQGLKGLDLALEAIKVANRGASLTLIGSGEYEPALQRKVEELGLGASVQFAGRKPREEVLKLYPSFDLFVFPSLHDTGGYAVIEAMLNQLPVVCLDTGGPAIAVEDGCGCRVPLGPRAEVIQRLSAALVFYDSTRSALREHGAAARESVLRNYDWREKCQRMSQLYIEAASHNRAKGGT